MRRVAIELERALRGGRIAGVGLLEDGRFAVRVGALRGRPDATLAVDAFGSPPTATLTALEISPAVDPGWTRAIAAALRGMRVASVRARRGDRVLVVSVATQSRFGVENQLRLVLELVPRFGNVLVIRDRTIVAAAKQFSPAENEARSIQAGAPYTPPPLPTPRLNRAGFVAAVAGDRRAQVRALGGFRPDLPRLLAESLVAAAEAIPWRSAAELAGFLEMKTEAIIASTAGEPEGLGDVYAYYDGERLVQAHVLPLAQYAGLRCERLPQLLPLLAAGRADDDAVRASSKVERRRGALAQRIAKRLAAIGAETAAVRIKRDDAAGRDELRVAGELLYTHQHDVPPGAATFLPPAPAAAIQLDPELDAKSNAHAYFARYRKATDALPHLERRLATLAARAASLDDLAFETERADAGGLDEIAAALDELDGKRAVAARAVHGKPRAILRIEQPSGARIYVGRSPRENVEVTFRIARPDDLWFHARNIPGSHVVLQAPDGGAPADDDLDVAANLAATHSKARLSPRVDVDYTKRKHVRKQRDAAPGLVWYTDARTRVGRPQTHASGESPPR